MDNALSIGKRAFAIAVAAATIVWSVGLASFSVPQAQAAASEGDLIKGTSLSTVYFYGYDGQRYTFPNEKTFFSWFTDFSDTVTLSDGDLADIDLAGNAVVRPGTYWIKITSDPKAYAVSTDGTIRWIEDEDTAVDFAGSNWASGIIDVPDAFFVDYTTGSSLMSAEAFDGMEYMDGGDYFLAWDGEKRMITSAGMTANHYQSKFFLDGSGIDDSALTDGDDITSEVSALTDPSQMGGDTTGGGELEVSVASSSPSSMSIPDTAFGVEVATFKFHANDAATLSSLTVTLDGLATTADFDNVYLYEDGARLTDGRSLNASTRQVTFAGLGMDFDANEHHNISVVVDMADNNDSGSFAFTIDDADDVDSDGDVSGSFPVEGDTMDIEEDIDVGEITITDTGSLTDPVLGETDAEVAKFRLDASGDEDIDVNSITLKIEDAADHSNFTLWNGSDEVATGEDIGDDLVLFEFDSPFFLEEGDTEDFTLSLDVGGDVDDTITTFLDNAADIDAVGRDFGFGVGVVFDGYDGTAGDVSEVTIEGGEVTIAFNGPSASDIKNGADDVSLFDFTITAQRWIEISDMVFNVAGDDLEDGANLACEDFKVVNADTGALVTGPEEFDTSGNDDNDLPVAFSDTFTIEAGDTLDLSFTCDVNEDVVAAGESLTATLVMSEFTIEDENGDDVTDIVPGSDLAGYEQTIQDATLTLGLASTPTGDTAYVKGTSNVEVVGFTFTASNGSDLTITDLTVTAYVDEDSDGTFGAGEDATDGEDGDVTAADRINSCSLYDDSSDTLIAGPESIEDDGEILFENFSYDVPAGESEAAVVKCNLANVSNGGTADEFAFEIDAETDVTVEDDEGDALADADISGDPVNSAEAVKISVVDSGTLTVTSASDAPDSDFLMTGSSSNTVAKFRFDSADEAFVVNRLTVTEEQAEADNGTANSDAYANNVSSVSISYPKADGTTGTASGSLTGNEITFNSVTMYVPKDDDATVTVKVNVATSDRHSGSATSNEKIRMGLSRDNGNDDQVRAVGQSSGVTLDDDNIDTIDSADAANTDQGTFVVRETKPTVALHSSSPSGSNKTPGDQEVYRFTVAANSGEDLVLNMLNFAISSTDNDDSDYNFCDSDSSAGGFDESSFDLYNLSTLGTGTAIDSDADWTFLTTDGTVCTEDNDEVTFAQVSFDDENVVPAGSTYTYALYIDLSGISSDPDDSIQVSLAGDPIVSTFLSASALNENNLTATDTTITVAAASTYTVGDVLCMDTADDGCGAADERMLVVVDGGTDLTVVRGYLNSDPDATSANDTNDDVDRIPGAMLWEDDGNEADTTAAQELFGAYLVDSLPVTGNALGF